MRRSILAASVVLIVVGICFASQQTSTSDEGGRVLALENAWNHALESKDAKALDMLLANTLVSVDVDGSVSTKGEFLNSIKAADYQPSQIVTEQSSVQVYGDAAVVTGIYREKAVEKGKSVIKRQRYTDTWIKINGSWQCVASSAVLITGKQAAD
jgi:ketosteroid isomerase-like protein